MRAIVLLLLLIQAPAPALAGAWPRGEGEAFVSIKGAAAPGPWFDLDPSFALYAEYGLGPRLTLGVSYDKLSPPFSLAKGFVRRNINAPDATWQVALEAGAGVEFDDTALGFDRVPYWRPVPYFPEPGLREYLFLRPPGDDETVYFDDTTGSFVTLPDDAAFVPDEFRPIETDLERAPSTGVLLGAAHLGRGFETPIGNAWVDMRLGVEVALDDRPALYKFDAVAGVSVGERGFVSVEMRAARAGDYDGLHLVPTVGYELRPGLDATLGAIVDMRSDDPARVEVGAWVTF